MMVDAGFRLKFADVARQELAELTGTERGDPVLRGHIRKFFVDLGLPVPEDIDEYHYSAIFVSWCMRQAGASDDNFPTAVAHWTYASKAIDAPPGAFLRAHEIATVTPREGDIVHVNRDGGHVDLARAKDGHYFSESGVVVSVAPASGGGAATIVMGNGPSGSVESEDLALTADGRIVQRAYNPIICLISVGD